MNLTSYFPIYINITFALALLTPGPNFIMIENNTINFGKKAGILAALGVWFGSNIWLIVIHFSFSTIFNNSIIIKTISILGTIYLYYLTYFILTTKENLKEKSSNLKNISTNVQNGKSFAQGLGTCIVNPEILAFYSAIFIQIADYNNSNPSWFKDYYLYIMSIIIIIVFTSISIVSDFLIKKMNNNSSLFVKYINRFFAIFLFINAIKMTFYTIEKFITNH